MAEENGDDPTVPFLKSMAEENGDDSTVPLLTKVKSDHDAKSSKSSWFSNCFPFFFWKRKISPTRLLDETPLPALDQVDLRNCSQINFADGIIYYEDLVVGTGKAVMMEKETEFYLQEVKYHYNHYNGSAELVNSSDHSPLTYSFCRNRCLWLGMGIQRMKEGGIRRIVIVPPKHESPYNILSPGHKSADREIFDVHLVKVGISEFCEQLRKFPAGKNDDAERAKMLP